MCLLFPSDKVLRNKQNVFPCTVGGNSPWLGAPKKQKFLVDGHVVASTGTYQDRRDAAQATWKLDEGEALFVHEMKTLLAQEKRFESITLYL